MQKAILFISLFLVVIFLSFVRFGKEEPFTNFFGIDFTSKNDGTPSALNSKNPTLPVTQPYAPDLAEMGVGNILPGPDSSDALPKAPFGSISKAVPTPYKDPSMEPAKYIHILGVKEDLQAFFAFQSGPIEDSSDPSIQIPLNRARADVGELVDVQSVLERNPGLPSRITNKQLDDVQSNLRYLQSILRDLENSGAIPKGPVASEGFDDMTPSATTKRVPATLDQLQDFENKVQAEIKRLSASATTDPVITARINTLTRILADVTGTMVKIKNGFYTPQTVPIYESDIQKALPLLGSPTSPLPTILNKFNLPPAIANLFPGGLSPSDTEQAAQINNILKGYMGQIFEGTSWGIDLNVKYDSPRAEKIYGQNHLNVDLEVGVPGFDQQGQKGQKGQNTQNGPWQQKEQQQGQGFPLSPTGNSLGDSSYNRGLPGTSDRTMPVPVAGGLDWKQRAAEITDQVKKRGIDPLLFGALPANTEVSSSFNWKGYTSMFCSRLAANNDPGVPQSVGCPSRDWPGWKESN